MARVPAQFKTEDLKTELVNDKRGMYVVLMVPGSSGSEYRVDVTNKRCSCPSWKFAKAGPDGVRPMCKHLLGLGFADALPLVPVKVEKQLTLNLQHKVML